MVAVRQLDGGIDEGAAALGLGGLVGAKKAQPGEQLAHGIVEMRRRDAAMGGVHLGGKPAQAFGDQLVLRGEMAVERHLVGAGGLGDGVDADAADAMAIEQVARHRDDPLPRRGSAGGRVGRYRFECGQRHLPIPP